MLAKNPDDRFSVVQVLAHPWTNTHYCESNNRKKVSNQSSISIMRTVKESTMGPFLDHLFNVELQNDFEKTGFYDHITNVSTNYLNVKRLLKQPLLARNCDYCLYSKGKKGNEKRSNI